MSNAMRTYKPLPVDGGWQVWYFERVYHEDRKPAWRFDAIRPIDGAKVYTKRQAAYRRAKQLREIEYPYERCTDPLCRGNCPKCQAKRTGSRSK